MTVCRRTLHIVVIHGSMDILATRSQKPLIRPNPTETESTQIKAFSHAWARTSVGRACSTNGTEQSLCSATDFVMVLLQELCRNSRRLGRSTRRPVSITMATEQTTTVRLLTDRSSR